MKKETLDKMEDISLVFLFIIPFLGLATMIAVIVVGVVQS